MKLLTLLVSLIPCLGFSNQFDEYFAELLADKITKRRVHKWDRNCGNMGIYASRSCNTVLEPVQNLLNNV